MEGWFNWDVYDDYQIELNKYKRILIANNDITKFNKETINGTGYIVDTLETALYSFLTTSNYKDAICTSINFGFDTDTTACITGGIAGMYYGAKNIPKNLINKIIRKDDINKLIEDFILSYNKNFK